MVCLRLRGEEEGDDVRGGAGFKYGLRGREGDVALVMSMGPILYREVV